METMIEFLQIISATETTSEYDNYNLNDNKHATFPLPAVIDKVDVETNGLDEASMSKSNNCSVGNSLVIFIAESTAGDTTIFEADD